MKFETPEWDYWLHLPTVTASEALLLSFDICPDDYERRLGEFDVSEAFDRSHEKRRRLLFAHLENPESFNFQKKRLRHTEIHLAEFARWATQDMGWKDLPPQLMDLADKERNAKSECATTPSVSIDDSSNSSAKPPHDWRDKARDIADEVFEEALKGGWEHNLASVSAKVTEIMRKRGITGPRGFIDNPNTVMREALQGGKWFRKKIKSRR